MHTRAHERTQTRTHAQTHKRTHTHMHTRTQPRKRTYALGSSGSHVCRSTPINSHHSPSGCPEVDPSSTFAYDTTPIADVPPPTRPPSKPCHLTRWSRPLTSLVGPHVSSPTPNTLQLRARQYHPSHGIDCIELGRRVGRVKTS